MGPTGLLTPDGSQISYMIASVSSGIPFMAPEEETNLNDFFGSFSGDYAVEGSLELSLDDGFGGGGMGGPYFQLANVNFSAVPEPSTYAAILGAGALGLMVRRRRREGQKDRSLPLDAEV